MARSRVLLIAGCMLAANLLAANASAAPKPASTTAAKEQESKKQESKKEESNEQPKKPEAMVIGDEELAKVFFKLPSRAIQDGSKGDADGLLRAVPWRSIGEDGASAPQVRFSFGAEFKRGSSVADALAKAGATEPFFVEQRIVQATAEDCKALLGVIAAIEGARFEKAPESVKYRAISAGYGPFRFRKAEDGKVEMFAYAATGGEIWVPVELPALRKMIEGLAAQLEEFGKSPQTISFKKNGKNHP
ncbi:MAG: hypothetical protein ABI318_00440 [Chthoniobacteraceae bacterium]